MVLTQQQHLDGQVRVREQRRERDELVEHLDGRRALRRPARADDLALLVDADDPPLGRHRVHDPHAVIVQERVELLAQRAEVAGLDLDELAVGADDVDHEPAHRHLEAVARLGEQLLYGGMKRALAQYPDARHGREG